MRQETVGELFYMKVPVVRLTFVVEGAAEVERYITGISARLLDMTSFWLWAAYSVIFPSIAINFMEQGRPLPWEDYVVDETGRSRYREWKEENFPGKGLLRLTDRLMNAFASPQGNPDTTVEAEASALTVGFRVLYGVYHQSRLPRKTRLPRRRFLMLQEQDVVSLQRGLQVYARTGNVGGEGGGAWAGSSAW